MNFTVEDALRLRVPQQETIAPDGRHAAWLETCAASDVADPILVVRALDGGEPWTVAAPELDGLCWAPSSDQILLVNRADRSQLAVVDVHSRELKVIVQTEGLFTSPQWRPAHRSVSAIEFEVDRLTPEGGPPLAGDLVGVFPREEPRGRVVEYDLGSLRGRPLTPDGVHVWGYGFSPDGQRLAYIRSSSRRAEDLIASRAEIALLDLTSGEEVVAGADIRATSATLGNLAWSPDGARLACLAAVFPERQSPTCCFVLDGSTCEVITRQVDESSTLVGVAWISGEKLVFERVEGVHSALYATGQELECPRRLAPVAGAGGALGYELAWDRSSLRQRLSDDGSRMCSTWSSGSEPPEVWGGPLADLSQLSAMNASLRDRTYSPAQLVEWDSDGLAIQGILIAPLGAVEPPFPTYVQLHGGPGEAWLDCFYGNWNFLAQTLATRGIATLMPNPRGSAGRGASFFDIYGRWMLEDAEDILRGIEFGVAEGLIDESRVALGGYSYGGFCVPALLTRTDGFRAAIMGAGWSNNTNHALQTDAPLFNGPAIVGKRFTDDPDLYWERSPIRGLGRVSTPMLIAHGEGDLRISVSEARATYQALAEAGCDVELVIYPNEGHVLSRLSSQEDYMRRSIAFLERHLLASSTNASSPATTGRTS